MYSIKRHILPILEKRFQNNIALSLSGARQVGKSTLCDYLFRGVKKVNFDSKLLSTVALRRYSPYTVTTYTFLLAAVGSWFICSPMDMLSKFSGTTDLPGLVFFCVLTALVTAVIPFLSYTLGLRTVEASKAGIIATLEPVVATIVGIVCFSEMLTLMSGMGIFLVLAAVVVLNWNKNADL